MKDFQPVSLIARLPNMLVVNPKMPAKTVAELIEHLKQNPGKLTYGSSGAGTSTHLAAELFQLKTGTKMTHVPYRTSGDVMNTLIGGHIDLAFDNITLAWPQVKAGTLRALGVTSAQPSATAPEVPPIADTLAGFEATSWHGVFAPAGTPKPIVDAMAAEVKRIFEPPDVQKTPVRGRRGRVADDARGVHRVHRRRAPKWQEVVQGRGSPGAVTLRAWTY